jgi:hypothetical protein
MTAGMRHDDDDQSGKGATGEFNEQSVSDVEILMVN